MIEDDVYTDNVGAEGSDSLRSRGVFPGQTLAEAIDMLKGAEYTVEYTRPVRGAVDSGTPRIVRVRNNVITAAFFNDTLKEDNI